MSRELGTDGFVAELIIVGSAVDVGLPGCGISKANADRFVRKVQRDAMECQTMALMQFLSANWELEVDEDAKLRILNFLRSQYPKT
jgi:hypothetical protein